MEVARSSAEAHAELKKSEAAPSYADLQAAFPGGKVKRDAKGKRCGFEYPKAPTPAARRAMNRKVYELWDPARRLDIENGARRNAAVSSVRVRDRAGRERLVPEQQAERACRSKGMVPVQRYRGRIVLTERDVRAETAEQSEARARRPLRTAAEIRGAA